jgi:hypothetical protein
VTPTIRFSHRCLLSLVAIVPKREGNGFVANHVTCVLQAGGAAFPIWVSEVPTSERRVSWRPHQGQRTAGPRIRFDGALPNVRVNCGMS